EYQVSGLDQAGDVVAEVEVDLGSAREHVLAERLLRATGRAQYSAEEYVKAVDFVRAARAETGERPSASAAEPALKLHPDPSLDPAALTVARERGLIAASENGQLDQASYDGAVEEAQRRLREGSAWSRSGS